MGAKKTAWHPPFTGLLQERAPAWAKITGEVQLTAEPLRVDDVIEVWADHPHDPTDTGSTLREMWRYILEVGLLEYKSIVWPCQHGDLSRLLACGMLWRTPHRQRSRAPNGARRERLAAHEITLILAVPWINGALLDELADLGLALPASKTGYYYIEGALLPLLIIDLRAAAEREDDDLLRCFAGLPYQTVETRGWMRQHWRVDGEHMSTTATPDLYGFDEFIEQMLQDFTPKQRLKGVPPEQRLLDLSEAEQVLALPLHMLRLLPESYLATLPADVQTKVRARRVGQG